MPTTFWLRLALLTGTVSCAASAVGTTVTAIPTIAAPADAALDSAYRHGDADAAASLMSDSVVIAADGIPDLVGRSAIHDLLAQFFQSTRVEAFTLTANEVVVENDHAFERGTFLWVAGPKGVAATRRTGRYTLLRVRKNGRWLMHRYIENCLPAPCPKSGASSPRPDEELDLAARWSSVVD